MFSIVPLLVFCYFVPALLSNTGVIPLESDLYTFIRRVLLPASLPALAGSLRLGDRVREDRSRPMPCPAGSISTTTARGTRSGSFPTPSSTSRRSFRARSSGWGG